MSLKEQVARGDTEKVDFDQPVAHVREKSEQRLVRLHVALVGHNWTDNLARSPATESINAVNSVVQQLCYDVVSRLRQGPESAYSTVSML